MAGGLCSILLVEDNPIDVDLARERLRAGGLSFDLTSVDNRAAFISTFQAGRFDLVLADYSLPDFDGLAALEIVRSHDKRLPFIFVSGVLGEDVAVETLLRGATDYVLKSRMDRLVPAVKRALAEHAQLLSRERAEEGLRASERRFEALTNALPAMVWTSEEDSRLTFVNQQWVNSVGTADFLFAPEIIHPRDLDLCINTWERARVSLQPFEIDCRYRIASDNSYRWHLVRGIPMPAEAGKPQEWVGTATDTEQQRSREAQLRTTEKLALTGRLSSVIAHEINNPLEALTNILYLLGSGNLDHEQNRMHLRLAEQELVRITAITKQTLQWSREESVITEVSAESIVAETLKLFSRKLQNKLVDVQLEIDRAVTIRAVSGELRQVLSNLISNAIDAIPAHGQIIINVSVVDRGEIRYACISVADNGTGIKPDHLKRLFQPFHSTKGALGSGLGLFISRELVERQGGELVAESTLGQGTTMSIFFPLVDSESVQSDATVSVHGKQSV